MSKEELQTYIRLSSLFLLTALLQACSESNNQEVQGQQTLKHNTVSDRKKAKSCETACASASLTSLTRAGKFNAIPVSHHEQEATSGNEAVAATDGMVWIPGGKFEMGTDDPDFP